MKKNNKTNNLFAYQKARRESSLKKIDEAVHYLYENGLDLSNKNISTTAGVSNSLMYRDYVIEYLNNHPVYNHTKHVKELKYEDRIKKLEKELEALKRKNKTLTKKNEKLSAEVEVKNSVIIDTVEKNKRLLGVIHNLQEENFMYKKKTKGFVVVDSAYEHPNNNEVDNE